VICGNSEVSQQSAMWGAPRELWSPALFDETLRELASAHCAGVPYWPSSAFGGDLPHQVSAGTTSYYGVGAYLRSTDDLRRSGLKFATECLGFANIPEQDTLDTLPGNASLRVHHPIWKRRAPRDLGAGWDFDDVRDHYMRQFFGVDPLELRYADHARYLELSRRVPAEAMTAAFTEWRRSGSSCGGALIWFLRDLWPGAGWGIIDSRGEPKAPYHALRQLLQPQWIAMTDEGLNGLAVHIGNETAQQMSAKLDLALYRDGQQLITRVQRDVAVELRSASTVNAASMLGEFHDLTHAYRFGALSCDLVIATLTDASNGRELQAFHLPYPHLHATPHPTCTLVAKARRGAVAGQYELTVKTSGFARSVRIDAPGYSTDSQYFHLAPGAEFTVMLRASPREARNLLGSVNALNISSAARIEILP
jgi:beta-mannosidase